MKKMLMLVVLLLLAIKPVAAMEKSGISIVPSFAEITINEDKPNSIDLIISNRTGFEEVFELSVVDFGSLNETGGVAFLTTKTDTSTRKYSLASWISLEKSEVIVGSGQSQKVKVTILNKESLSPGGHYGAVLATVQSNDVRQSDSVGINQTMASLLYVLKTGGETYKLTVKEVTKKTDFWGMPNKIGVRLINEGNVHVVPRGAYEINFAGKQVAKGILNGESGKILPESVRTFEFGIKKINRWNWPGKYETKLSLRYDDNNDFTVQKGNFFYWGYEGWTLGLMFLVFMFVILLKIGKKI